MRMRRHLELASGFLLLRRVIRTSGIRPDRSTNTTGLPVCLHSRACKNQQRSDPGILRRIHGHRRERHGSRASNDHSRLPRKENVANTSPSSIATRAIKEGGLPQRVDKSCFSGGRKDSFTRRSASKSTGLSGRSDQTNSATLIVLRKRWHQAIGKTRDRRSREKRLHISSSARG